MKPGLFEYHRAATVDDVLASLESLDDALILAGGQSLIPAMNFRLATPAALIDIGKIDDLRAITITEDEVIVGANVRHRDLELDDEVHRCNPVLRLALHHVAHVPIRHRGTTVGSICHADAAAEMPMILVLTGGHVTAVSRARGRRTIPAEEFFQFHMTTARAPDEFIVSAHFPRLPAGAGCGFAEFARRRGDYAIAALGAIVALDGDGRVASARLAACGIANKPVRLADAEAALLGQRPEAEVLDRVGKIAAEAVTVPDDLNASTAYRRHLVGGLLRRAIEQAVQGRQK